MIRYSLFVFITVLAFESSPYAQECNWQDGIEIEDRGDFSGAIKVYNRCIELNPTDDWYYYCRARPKAKSGDYEGSISDYSTAIDLVLEREDVVPYYYYQTRAEVHMENGYLSKALTDFNKALKVKPDHLGIIFNKGIIKLKMDRPFEALQDFNNALDNGIFPGADIFYYRGTCKLYLEDYRGALLDLDKSVELDPESVSSYLNRAMAHYKLKNYEAAMSDCNKLIELFSVNDDGTSPKAILAKNYFNRGLVNFALGKTDEGCLDLSRAGELGLREAYQEIRDKCN